MKKTKLFLSICMMCFCISFICFGMYDVYASQNVLYTINGTITYTAEIELVDFYLELGQVSPTDATKIKWKLVYLDNMSWNTLSTNWSTMTNSERENYVDLTIGKLKGRGAVFVQETALGTFQYEFDYSIGTSLTCTNGDAGWRSWGEFTNYFTQCFLRSYLKGGKLFSLTDEEQEYLQDNVIKARTLPGIYDSYYDNDNEPSRFYYPLGSSQLTDTKSETDYFWLMSIDEVCSYFLRNTDTIDYISENTCIQWKPSNVAKAFWLRNPCYYALGGQMIATVGIDGSFGGVGGTGKCSVRAAFQLA